MMEDLLALPARVDALERALAGSSRPQMIVREQYTSIALWTPDLTDRQCELLPYLAAGWSNEEIARELKVAERTVRTHVSHILNTLNTTNRTTLALWALAAGQVSMQEAVGLMARKQPHLVAEVLE